MRTLKEWRAIGCVLSLVVLSGCGPAKDDSTSESDHASAPAPASSQPAVTNQPPAPAQTPATTQPPGTAQPPPTTQAAGTARPSMTPHPAVAAQRRALELYPDLAVKDSLFNKTFVALVQQARETDPRQLTMADWPLTIAQRTGGELGIRPGPKATPLPPPTPPPAPVTPKLMGTLDQGAYHQSRVTPRTPVTTR